MFVFSKAGFRLVHVIFCQVINTTPEQKGIKLVNVGIYMINNNLIINNIRKIKNNNSQNEYYLPDLMMILVEQGYLVIPKLLHNPNELINVNTQKDLLMANSVKRF